MLLLSTLLVGFTEELMFRGLGITVFRANAAVLVLVRRRRVEPAAA